MMTEEKYNERLKEIEYECEIKKRQLYIDYAKSHELFSVGDIICDSSNIIRIERITVGKDFGFPYPVYRGVELKKDLTEKKNNARSAVYGNGRAKLIKSKA